MQNKIYPDDHISTHIIHNDMNRGGFNRVAANIALTKLLKKNMIKSKEIIDYQGDEYYAYALSNKGEQWLLDNEDKLVLRENLIDEAPF